MLLERSWTSIFHYFGVTVPAFLCSSTLQGTAFQQKNEQRGFQKRTKNHFKKNSKNASNTRGGALRKHFPSAAHSETLFGGPPSPPPKLGGVISHFLLLSLHVFLGRVHGDAEIVPEKNRESFPLSANVFWCWLRMLLLAEYWGVLK